MLPIMTLHRKVHMWTVPHSSAISSREDSVSSSSIPFGWKSACFHRGVISQLLPTPLQCGIFFLQLSLPVISTACLAGSAAPKEAIYRLPHKSLHVRRLRHPSMSYTAGCFPGALSDLLRNIRALIRVSIRSYAAEALFEIARGLNLQRHQDANSGR